MRMPWSKSKGEQLDLLDTIAVASTDAIAFDERGPGAVEVAVAPLATSREALVLEVSVGEAHVVAIERLQEDPNNPRTEFPAYRLDELAEDIRQHGILQPIVVHPVDALGNHRIHFGAMRLRAAKRAGLRSVPIAIRTATADPYAQVAENQQRCPLQPLELARFIRGRSDAGDSNATIAKRLGMDLTTVAHHLALLDLPPELDQALKTGRCTSPRTLYERPTQVSALMNGEGEITRSTVAALRAASASSGASSAAVAKHSTSLIEQVSATCTRLEALVSRLKKSQSAQAQIELAALRHRIADLVDRLA
jgi:ParB family transcriptional regulator, chromosome partitioning protein